MKDLIFRSGIFVLCTLLLWSGCGKKKGTVKPTMHSITESVYSSITIQPDSLYEAFAVVPGIIDRCEVKEGDLVQKGQVLMHLVNDRSELMTQNSRLSMDLVRQNLNGKAAVVRELEQEIETARLKLKNDSVNYFRQKRLWDDHIGSQIEYDNRKLSYELSQNNLQQLQKRYERTKNELQTQLKQAENTYQSNLSSNDDYTIKSEINGKVYDLYKEQGELVNIQQPVASIGSADDFMIEMLVDEVDIVRLKTGQVVIITLDAYPERVFRAEVTKIYPAKNERTQTFKVEGKFQQAPETLYPGLTGEANIIVNRHDKALTIPLDYLGDSNTVVTEDGPVKVTTGLRNMNEVEILSGLDTNSVILKPTP